MEHGDQSSGVTLAELLAAFSLATDLGLGQPMEHVLRSWQIAAGLATQMGVPREQRAALFQVAMLAWVGCVADAPEVAASFGDDIVFRADSYDADLAGLSGIQFFLSHAGRGRSAAHRARAMATLVATGGNRVVRGIQNHCLTTSTLADQLGLAPAVGTALRQFFARWDGKGVPPGVKGDDLALPIRLFHVADVVEVRQRLGGIDAALRTARARRGSQFDPAVVDVFCANARELFADLEKVAGPQEMIAAEPILLQQMSNERLDDALAVLADFTDLRSPSRAGHSRGVATLAGEAARSVGLSTADETAVRRAGYVHDIGLHGVPATILEKPAALTATEWERIRLSSYYTERVLARPSALARFGSIAALAHERVDGSGYHRGITGPALPMSGRILAAACAYRALVEPRAYRPALTSKQAAGLVRDDVRLGRLDPVAVDAVLSAAGATSRRRVSGPAGLTSRELEVLVLIARGAATSEVADRLGITPKTASTHIERIYTKTGASSRSTVTLFALRNGLLDPLDL